MPNIKSTLVEKIKKVIIEKADTSEEWPRKNFSKLLSEDLHYNYTYLANLFSKSTGMTIEQYIIEHKIEHAKDLLRRNKLNLTQIASLLNYSSVAHLSNQFKKVTGLTPTFFKRLKCIKKPNLSLVK